PRAARPPADRASSRHRRRRAGSAARPRRTGRSPRAAAASRTTRSAGMARPPVARVAPPTARDARRPSSPPPPPPPPGSAAGPPRAGRRLDERVAAARDRRPAEPLCGGRLREGLIEPRPRFRAKKRQRIHDARLLTDVGLQPALEGSDPEGLTLRRSSQSRVT